MKNTLLTVACLFAINAFADRGIPRDQGNIQVLDTDGDHLISLAEAQAGDPGLASHFDVIDANKDGFLSIDEILANQPKGNVLFNRDLRADFAAADTNGDGLLTRAEVKGKMPLVSDLFDEMDANNDGFVSQDEIREHARKHGPIRFRVERVPAPSNE